MTNPRSVLRKQVGHIVRRCARREDRLKPDAQVTNLIGYLLATCATRYQMEVHAFCAMWNHYHISLSDPHGRRSEFVGTFNSLLAQALNFHQGVVHQSLFDNREPSVTIALEPESAMEDVAYITLNPLKAGVVFEVVDLADYEGLLIGPEQWGTSVVFDHPGFYFKDPKFLPEAVLQPVPPPGFEHLALEEVKDLARHYINAEYEEFVRSCPEWWKNLKAQSSSQRQQLQKIWRVQFRKQQRRRRKLSRRELGAYELRPRYSFKRRQAFMNAREGDGQYLKAYRSAMQLFREGDREVEFPEGTNQLSRRNLVNVEQTQALGWYRYA